MCKYFLPKRKTGTLTGSCPWGYVQQEGDAPGWGSDIGSSLDLNKYECAKRCDSQTTCLSFEHSLKQMKCNLNKIADPSEIPYYDYIFCTKQGSIINHNHIELSNIHDNYLSPKF